MTKPFFKLFPFTTVLLLISNLAMADSLAARQPATGPKDAAFLSCIKGKEIIEIDYAGSDFVNDNMQENEIRVSKDGGKTWRPFNAFSSGSGWSGDEYIITHQEASGALITVETKDFKTASASLDVDDLSCTFFQ